MASTNNENNVCQLTNIADIYGLRHLISEPTPITDKSAILIDYCLVSAFRKLSINFRKGHTSVMYRNFKTFKSLKFRNDIYNKNWEFLDSGLDPSQMWTEWKTKFVKVVEKHAPIHIKRVRSKRCP